MKLQLLSICVLLLLSCSSKKELTQSIPPKEHSTTLKIPSIEALQKDANILWMGEVEVDYGLNFYSFEATEEKKIFMRRIGVDDINTYKILKYQVDDLDDSQNEEHDLLYKIIKNVHQFECYKTSAFKEPYTSEDVSQIVETLGLKETLGGTTKNNMPSFRLKQLIYYNKKELLFKTIPLGLAPLLCVYDDKGNYLYNKAVFWMRPQAVITKEILLDPRITWAKRMYRTINLKEAKVLKESISMNQLFDVMLKSIKENVDDLNLGSVVDADGNTKLTREDIDDLLEYDVSTETKGNLKIRLLQDWVWNEVTKEISMLYVGFKLNAEVLNVAEDIIYAGPIFTRKLEDLKAEIKRE